VRIIAALAIALMVAGCIASAPVATDRQRDDALLTLNTCLDTAARKLDDGTSEASTIALGMRPACAREFAWSRDVYASNLNPAAAQIFHRSDDQAFIQLATAAVLSERATRRQQKQ
jgi:hypothetical protein